jgi:hypothetical protein
MSDRQRRIEIETIAQAAALEDLREFYEAVLNNRIVAERAALFIGGHTQARFEQMIVAVRHALEHLASPSLQTAGVVKRAGRRLRAPAFELQTLPQPSRACRVDSAEALALPLTDARSMRERGMTWRQIRDAMLRDVAS